jgi:hypothetical protein
MLASTQIDGLSMTPDAGAADTRPASTALHLSDRWPCLAAILPVFALAAVVTALLPPYASAEGMDGARTSLPAETTVAVRAEAAAARKTREGRLSKNGTRSPEDKVAAGDAAAVAPGVKAAARLAPAGAKPDLAPIPVRLAVPSSPAAPAGVAVPATPPASVAANTVPIASPAAASIDCLAGCLTPDRTGLFARTTAATRLQAPSSGTGSLQALTTGTEGGVDCIAGCYGSGMEKVAQRRLEPSTPPPSMTTTEGKEGTSVRVLRGVTRKRNYGSTR